MVHSARDAAGRRAPRSDPRQQLLDAALAYVAQHGVYQLSLRELAAEIGTSHRMLIYHFGSKEALMVAIVEQVEEQQRQFFGSLTLDLSLSPGDAARAFWRRLTDPRLEQNVRLFFELYTEALQGVPGTEQFLDRIVDAWVEPLTEAWVRRGLPRAIARVDARLGVAVSRGLLLDLIATGNRAAVDRAFERFVQIYERATDQAQT